MTPTPDVQAAVWGAALRMRAELRHLADTHRLTRYRQESPELFEAADELVAAFDSVDPPRELPRCGSCDYCRGLSAAAG